LQLRLTGGRAWRRPVLQTQVREDPFDHRLPGTEALAFAKHKWSSGPFVSGLTPQDRRDDLQLAAAIRAMLHIDLGVSHALHRYAAVAYAICSSSRLRSFF